MRRRGRGIASGLTIAAIVFGGAFGDDGTSRELGEVAKVYGIEVVADMPELPVATAHGAIAGVAAGREALASYTPLFAGEFSFYPTGLVRRSGLRRVVLCEGLAFAGQRRGAVPDYEHDTLYLDVARGAYSKDYLRAVIHHEFFHVVDYKDDGHVYEDDGWAALNPDGFTYGAGGIGAQEHAETSLLTDARPGFLTHYGTTGVEEDKAELFAHMLLHYNYVEGRAAKDPILAAKVGRMNRLLSDFTPDANAALWEKARVAKRGG